MDVDKSLGKNLKSKFQDFEKMILKLDQEYIIAKMNNGIINIKFEEQNYACKVVERTVESENFIPRVIEPSFCISRILYALVEQSFKIRDDRNVLSLKPKMCYKHVMISSLRPISEHKEALESLKRDFKSNEIRFLISDRGCSIGRKYSSSDEIGIPYFVTFDPESNNDSSVTIRERDSISQVRVKLDKVSSIIMKLISEETDWQTLYCLFGI